MTSTLLRPTKTEEAWIKLIHPTPLALPSLSLYSPTRTHAWAPYARSIVTPLRHERHFHRFHPNYLDRLAVAADKSKHTLYAYFIMKYMPCSSYLLPISRCEAADDGPTKALKLFDSVVCRVCKFSELAIMSEL